MALAVFRCLDMLLLGRADMTVGTGSRLACGIARLTMFKLSGFTIGYLPALQPLLNTLLLIHIALHIGLHTL